MGRDTFHQTRLLKALSSLALNTSREGDFYIWTEKKYDYVGWKTIKSEVSVKSWSIVLLFNTMV